MFLKRESTSCSKDVWNEILQLVSFVTSFPCQKSSTILFLDTCHPLFLCRVLGTEKSYCTNGVYVLNSSWCIIKLEQGVENRYSWGRTYCTNKLRSLLMFIETMYQIWFRNDEGIVDFTQDKNKYAWVHWVLGAQEMHTYVVLECNRLIQSTCIFILSFFCGFSWFFPSFPSSLIVSTCHCISEIGIVLSPLTMNCLTATYHTGREKPPKIWLLKNDAWMLAKLFATVELQTKICLARRHFLATGRLPFL